MSKTKRPKKGRHSIAGVMAVLMTTSLVPERATAIQSMLAVGEEHVCVITSTGGVKVRLVSHYRVRVIWGWRF